MESGICRQLIVNDGAGSVGDDGQKKQRCVSREFRNLQNMFEEFVERGK